MVVEAQRLPVERFARVAELIAAGIDLRAALEAIAEAAAGATGADAAVVRVLDDAGCLAARAVSPPGSALAAELTGSRIEVEELGTASDSGSLVVPARLEGRVLGSVELVRAGAPFGAQEAALVDLAAAQLLLALRVLGAESGGGESGARVLETAGEAMAAGADGRRAAHQAVRVAADATGALGAALWLAGGERGIELVASHGAAASGLDRAEELARAALEAWRPLALERSDGLPDDAAFAASIQLGQPAFGVLQLLYAHDAPPSERELAALVTFGARAAHSLRAGERARRVEQELERTRSLLAVVGEAIARLSLAHTLETTVDRIAELLGIARVGVYLREDGDLGPAAGRGLPEGHEEIARRLLDLSLGRFRARATIHVRGADRDPGLAEVSAALRDAGVPGALAVPLHAREEPIGLLVAYPGARDIGESDVALLASLAAQLAVVVQNARLHEQATELGEALGSALASERQAARQIGALYEISRSFAQSLSLETTLEAVTTTIVEVLGVDAAVIRVPVERGDLLAPRSVHVADGRLHDAVRTILERPTPRPPRAGTARLVDAAEARRLGGAFSLLVPFLEKGSTAAVLPIATPAEMLAQLTILSLDPAGPISRETIETATTIAAQAALAIDNARLYQQQKQFAETIQRALLPRQEPEVPGLQLGAVYESAARVDVGGDVYDFLELADGRLAVVLGDVTGHGIDATADMAMAKFVFRSLAREHDEPGAFLAHANDVVVGEIAVGKFITMACVIIDPVGEVVCASAGHPAPRLLLPDGRVESLAARGLALGIDTPQTYEAVRADLPVGASVVLYTDGVIEARGATDLFGVERLDAALAARASLPAKELAQAVLATCRAFSGSDFADDFAIVVIRRIG